MRDFLLAACLAALSLSACTATAPQMADQAAAANALLALDESYQQAKDRLDARIDDVPTETGLVLLELEQQADLYRDALRAAWQTGVTPEQLDQLYLQGVRLWQQGRTAIEPVSSGLPPDLMQSLVDLDRQAQRLADQYRRLQQAGDTRELLRAGLELATLALRVGIMVAQ